MQKIIAALDGLKFSESTTNYAIQMAKQLNAHLVGVFMDDLTYHSYKIYDLIHSESDVLEAIVERSEAEDKERRESGTRLFEQACRSAGINYSIHHDRNIAIHELLHESVYADLLVIDRKETLTHYDEEPPTRFVRDLLANVECPVLMVSKYFKQIKKNILLYDGEPSSVFAIKMFSYMFPTLADIETEVLTIKPNHQTLHVPDNRLMKEFMKRHFHDATYTILKGLPDIEIVNHLKNRNQGELIVLGAYRRGMVSRWFRPSMADVLMQELNSPLFIAHK
ncbi:MAG TPA: universal stress protein [Puia sp.]|nr:universal stress protein [Puia sp.]